MSLRSKSLEFKLIKRKTVFGVCLGQLEPLWKGGTAFPVIREAALLATKKRTAVACRGHVAGHFRG